jgi:hypothetical protein
MRSSSVVIEVVVVRLFGMYPRKDASPRPPENHLANVPEDKSEEKPRSLVDGELGEAEEIVKGGFHSLIITVLRVNRP